MQTAKKKETFEAMAFSSLVGASLTNILKLPAQPEPDTPEEGESYMWMSNGVGVGDAGDAMIKTTLNDNVTFLKISPIGLVDLTEKSHDDLTEKGTKTHDELEAEIDEKLDSSHEDSSKHFRLETNYYNSRNPFLGDWIYIADLYNMLFAADKRFTVTQIGMAIADLPRLFSDTYEYYNKNTINSGETGVININFPSRSEIGCITNGIDYTEGYIYVTFYAYRYPDINDVSIRWQDVDNVWFTLGSGEDISVPSNRRVYRFSVPAGNSMVNLEISITASDSSWSVLSAIEYILKRPSNIQNSFFSKLSSEAIYYDTEWKDSNNETKTRIASGGVTIEHLKLTAVSADPADPPAKQSVRWLSDGTDSGDDGDIMMKITDSAGTTKITTRADFSTL